MHTNYMTISQLQRVLNLPKAYLQRMAVAGEIPSLMAGKNKRRFSEKDVRAALTRIANIEPRQRKQLLGAAR